MHQEGLILTFLVVAAATVLMTALAYRYKRRELEHKERLAALDKGSPLPALDSGIKPWTPRVYLLRGLMWLLSGVSMMIALGGLSVGVNHETPMETRIWRANRAKADGATDEQVRALYDEKTEHGLPFAVALLGLIPASVGLAYLITYRVEREDVKRAG